MLKMIVNDVILSIVISIQYFSKQLDIYYLYINRQHFNDFNIFAYTARQFLSNYHDENVSLRFSRNVMNVMNL